MNENESPKNMAIEESLDVIAKQNTLILNLLEVQQKHTRRARYYKIFGWVIKLSILGAIYYASTQFYMNIQKNIQMPDIQEKWNSMQEMMKNMEILEDKQDMIQKD